ncbi:MAG TPA: TetR family transcriptional regulator [Acidimicrobiales bacterium]|nr:TetR family transcriptional regulator [Acidimicrobiales bacterium]
MARTGRRPGPSTTRADILRAARHLFATNGYDATTIRGVAEAAKVDPALVVRAFGGKGGLFRAAVDWPWDPADVVPTVAHGPRGSTGRRIAGLFVGTWEDPDERAPIITLIRSAAGHEQSRMLLNQFVTSQLLVPIVRTAGFDQPEQRAAFIAAHLIGTGLARYVLAIEPLATMAPTCVTDVVGKVVQRILTVPLP